MNASKITRIETDIRFRLLKKFEFTELFETSCPEDVNLHYREWKNKRNALFDCLFTDWQEYSLRTQKGDFLVFDDWFGRRCLGVCFFTFRIFHQNTFRRICAFLQQLSKDYGVIIVGDFPDSPVLYEILITKHESAIRFIKDNDVKKYRKMKREDPEAQRWLDVIEPFVFSE